MWLEYPALQIVSVAPITDISVPYATPFEEINLPEHAVVILDDACSTCLEIVWDQGTYDGNTSGTYYLTGELILSDEIENPDALLTEVPPNSTRAGNFGNYRCREPY